MKSVQIGCYVLAGLMLLAGCAAKQPQGPADAVVFKTSQGEMVMELFPDLAPNAVDAFRRLVAAEVYDGLTFNGYERGKLLTTAVPQSNATAGIHTLTSTEIN